MKNVDIRVATINASINTKAVIQGACEELVSQIKKNASKGFGGKYSTGKYKDGWSWKFDISKYGTTGVVFNKDEPGLTHLLEFGHIVANQTGSHGRWYPPKKHIEPAYKKVRKKYLEHLKQAKITWETNDK